MHFITLFHLASISFPDLTSVNVLLTHSRSLSSHSLHQTHSVPVLNLITQSIVISASVSHYKHYYSSSWSVPLVSALSNDVCGPFCSSTNHSCWNGEKSLEARGNSSEKWSNSGARYKSEPHRSRTEGHKHFFLLGSRERVLRTGWNYYDTDQWATDIVLKHSSGFLLSICYLSLSVIGRGGKAKLLVIWLFFFLLTPGATLM